MVRSIRSSPDRARAFPDEIKRNGDGWTVGERETFLRLLFGKRDAINTTRQASGYSISNIIHHTSQNVLSSFSMPQKDSDRKVWHYVDHSQKLQDASIYDESEYRTDVFWLIHAGVS